MEAADEIEDQADEQICDSFVCCVCLDLLYKPIVLACGHVSCFWCVHRCMNGLRESHCPICRHPYHHFPTICQMLHFLLLKMYPVTYKRRGTQTLEYEKSIDCFSPEIKDPVHATSDSEKSNHQGDAGQLSPTDAREPSSSLSSLREGQAAANMEEQRFPPSFECVCLNQLKENSSGGLEVTNSDAAEEKLKSGKDNGAQVRVSIADMLCVACIQLLYRPVVLNCGHVFCETCISIPADEKLRCHVCQSLHPNGIPKVCLELHHFLEIQFPTEYELRRNTIKQVDSQQEAPHIESNKQRDHLSFTPEENFSPPWGDHNVHVHFGVGCDFCGMFPIIGNRYRCKDCVEAIGFDLCGDCYNTRSKLPGRFNQQHTPEHSFEVVGSNSIRRTILRLIMGQVEDGAAAPNIPEIDLENPENAIHPADDNVEVDGGNESVSFLISTSNPQEQSDEQSPPM
ncbi:hypothetical protein DCAR_0521249 [Daucus carota subsp. sativus]|uniref:RING-type domain-containing protein n=1 Tax=Daucus carota subsp. sativus TaxID=79200 RepID=A0AAF0X5R4_DAUCS|nr:hypothetical protein DCAR_0521249 [Daucus carota subsp. sativus]